MSLVGLDDNLKGYISQYLSIADYSSFQQTCKTFHNFCTNPLHESFFWKRVYHDAYSSIELQHEDNEPNPWKPRIQFIEKELKAKPIFSKKFQVCVESNCDKMGSLKKHLKDVDALVLTICLRDLLKKPEMNTDVKLNLAKALLDHGADPLKESNIYLEDYPLRIAVLNNDTKMVSLFIDSYLKKDDLSKESVRQLLEMVKKSNIVNQASLKLETFLI